MMKRLQALFGQSDHSVRIFGGIEAALPNFQILATNVRAGRAPQHYVLDDGEKLDAVVAKWRFEPGGVVGRCGYDYQIAFRNGDLEMSIATCFACNILIVDGAQKFTASRGQVKGLLEADLRRL